MYDPRRDSANWGSHLTSDAGEENYSNDCSNGSMQSTFRRGSHPDYHVNCNEGRPEHFPRSGRKRCWQSSMSSYKASDVYDGRFREQEYFSQSSEERQEHRHSVRPPTWHNSDYQDNRKFLYKNQNNEQTTHRTDFCKSKGMTKHVSQESKQRGSYSTVSHDDLDFQDSARNHSHLHSLPIRWNKFEQDGEYEETRSTHCNYREEPTLHNPSSDDNYRYSRQSECESRGQQHHLLQNKNYPSGVSKSNHINLRETREDYNQRGYSSSSFNSDLQFSQRPTGPFTFDEKRSRMFNEGGYHDDRHTSESYSDELRHQGRQGINGGRDLFEDGFKVTGTARTFTNTFDRSSDPSEFNNKLNMGAELGFRGVARGFEGNKNMCNPGENMVHSDFVSRSGEKLPFMSSINYRTGSRKDADTPVGVGIFGENNSNCNQTPPLICDVMNNVQGRMSVENPVIRALRDWQMRVKMTADKKDPIKVLHFTLVEAGVSQCMRML